MSTITPTIGRVVWFYPAVNAQISGFTPSNEGEPLAAIIARVVDADAGAVHLAVFDGAGVSRSEPYVQLLQEGQKAPEAGRYATWMPYQIGQAKKHTDTESGEQINQRRGIDLQTLRAHALDMALRTPGLSAHQEVLKAATAYQAHIEGQQPLTDAYILETFQYQLSIDGGNTELAAINTVRVLRGEAPNA